MENRDPSYADGREENCQHPLQRTAWCFPKKKKKLNNSATEPRALSLMDVYVGKPEKQRHTATPNLRAALFTSTSNSEHLKYRRKDKNG